MDKIKKILNWKIALFSLVLIFFLPRGSFIGNYREIVITGENIEPNSDIINLVPIGLRFEVPNEKKSEENKDRYILNKKIPEYYLIILRNTLSETEKIQIQIKENEEYRDIVKSEDVKKGIGEQRFWIKKSEIIKNSPLKYGKYLIGYILIYFIIFFIIKNFFENLDITWTNLSLGMLFIVYFVVTNNSEQFIKVYSLFFTFTFFYFIKKYIIDKSELKNNLIFLCVGIIPVFIVISEYYNLGKYEKSFTDFYYSFFMILIFLIFDYKKEEIKWILAFLYVASYMSAIVNISSPLIFSGVYTFTFAVPMVYLLLYSLEKILESYEYKEKKLFFIYLCGFLIGIYNVIYSGRRTTYVAIGLIIFLRILWELIKKRYILFLKSSLILTSFFYIIYKYNPFNVIFIAKTILDEKNSSNDQRILMWRRSIYMIRENFIKGIGTENFYNESIKEKYNLIKHPNDAFATEFIHAHNEYLEQWVSKGIGFFLVYIILFYEIIKSLIKSKNGIYWTMTGAMGIYGIFEPFSFRSEAIIPWSIFGAIILDNKNENQNKIISDKIVKIIIFINFLIGFILKVKYRQMLVVVTIIFLGYRFFESKIKNKNLTL